MNEKIDYITKRTKRIIMLTVKKSMDPIFAGSAAEVAFFLLMSLVPTSILLAQVLNLFELSMDAIRPLLNDYVNDEISTILLPYLTYYPSGAVSAALIVLAFWAGSKALFSLMRITNYAYLGGTPGKNPLAGYIRERIRAIITVLVILFTIVFALNIVVFGKIIVEGISTYINEYLGGSYNVSDVWLNIRWILAFALYFFMVASIYYLLPGSRNKYLHLITKSKYKSIRNIVGAWLRNSKRTFRTILPGSIFASVGMLIATWIYSLYLSYIATRNFNILYGSLNVAIMLLLWFYILSYILIIGIQINSVWEDSKIDKPIPDKYKEKIKDGN